MQVEKIKHSSETFSFKTSAQEDGKTKRFHIFSPYFLQVFFQLSPTVPNDKNEMFPSPVNKRLQEHCEGQNHFLLQ